MANSIRIDTVLETKKYDKQIERVRKDISTLEENAKQAKLGVSYMSNEELEENSREVEKLTNKLNGLYKAQTKASLSKISNIGFNTAMFQNGNLSFQRTGINGTAKSISDEYDGVAEKVSDINKEVGNLYKKNKEVSEETGKIDFNKAISSLKKFFGALVGLRGAYGLIRRASSAWLSQDTELSQKFQNIWVGLGALLKPVLDAIANAILKIIGYINVFIKTLSGGKIDLVATANKNVAALNKQTKAQDKLNKTTASFDEMNMLNDNSSSGGGLSSGGVTGFGDIELDEGIVKKVQDLAIWLQENWKWLAAIGSVIATFKVMSWISGLGGVTGALGKLAIALGEVGLAFVAWKVWEEVYYELKDLKQQIDDTKIAYQELDAMMNGVKNDTDDLIQTKKEESYTLKQNDEELARTKAYYDDLIDSTQRNNEAIKTEEEEMGWLEKQFRSATGELSEHDEQQARNTDTMYRAVDAYGALLEQGKLNDEEQAKLKRSIEATRTQIRENGKELIELNTIYDENGNVVKDGYEELSNMIKRLEELDNAISENGKKIYEDTTIFGKFKNAVNDVKTKVDETKTAMKNLDGTKANITIGATENVNSVMSNALSGLKSKYGAVLSTLGIKLATGGIVNNPGRGVSLGSAIVGEAGAEGVIPLTDTQAMETLGATIGKYITVNLTNNTNLDGRTIARKTSQIQGDRNFAMNR